ncbi:CRISPR system precrRNA processing endoribonuclease RAMP protein Cas6 [Aliivibrio fischeri]|uniref:CRISPR system precrRNA processing endoribonuclease RAMP protein Cas6 n=1 Tax=Aliivibrio fischeri TaxID=668 RepID=UPI0012D9494E|nr:CRISPR system precrRNA processing endoribonuclease RAMP protein Cas6 [Aliivibrio fischeri]MUK39229.1 CRISPR system precrRNA processing endoribonuclease RAMP protein Cas6 [Aliivibrio fischeri]
MLCKRNGQITKEPIGDLNFWLNQTLRRLTQFTQFWVNDSQRLIDDLYAQQLPINIEASESYGYYEDWQRYSLKQKEQLPFGGVKGQVSFYVQLGLAPILLKIAEVIHIGGKTTFGLGKVKLID